MMKIKIMVVVDKFWSLVGALWVWDQHGIYLKGEQNFNAHTLFSQKKIKSNLSRGYRVTLLEKNKNVAQVASSINGAMLCPSMCASWASLKLILKVRI